MNKPALIFIALILLGFSTLGFSKENSTVNTTESNIVGWKEIFFEGRTEYKNNGICIEAKSKASASGLTSEKHQKISANTKLVWAWSANQLISNGNGAPEKSKGGDDFLARVYVIHEGRFPWQSKAINYVWSSQHAVGDHWPNPFLKNAHMVVVQSGTKGLGELNYFERNIQKDFKTYFNMDIDKIDGVAIMTDTDNTQGEAQACYVLPVFLNATF